MRILIRDGDPKKWRVVESVATKAEVELQKLLVESPSLITIDEMREGASPLVFAVSEFGLPPIGAVDVLAFSPKGDIAMVECKLSANPDVRRKVIGQILEYAAYLWSRSYEEVDSQIQSLSGKSLADLVAEYAEEEWDEEEFREGVKKTLETGSFILIIVVDEVNEELRRIIKYLNECSNSAFSIHALEMKRFQVNQIDILVPQLHGTSVNPPPPGEWTEDLFFKVLSEKNEPNIIRLIRDLYDWSVRTADKVAFGRGLRKGSFTFQYIKEGIKISVFTLYTNKNLWLNFGWLRSHLPDDVIGEFHKMIIKIPGMQNIPASGWPSLSVEVLADQDAREKFKAAVLWLKSQIDEN